MSSAPLLYFHGGPGMNCAGERALLGPFPGGMIEFWEEPSRSRPNGDPFDPDRAFTGLVESVRRKMREVRRFCGPFHAVAHSFSAIAVTGVLLEEPELAACLTLVAPTLDYKREIKRILELAALDFGKADLAKEQKLRVLIQQSKAFFDEPMQAALALAGEDVELFKHYWHDSSAMARFFEAWQRRGTGMDLEAFFCVLKEFAGVVDRPAARSQLELPVTVVFGRYDPVSVMERELALCRELASNVDVRIFEESGHYPHLEEPQRFLATLASGTAPRFATVDGELVEKQDDVRPF